jgi:glycosyltransferase involved in cell wall biosynthesis
MKRVLFVTMHRPKRSPGQRFRFEQYISHLGKNGYCCDQSYIISESDDKIIYIPGNYSRKIVVFLKSLVIRLQDVCRAHRYDIIFIHREALMVNLGIIEHLFRYSGAKLVFDFDDAIWLKKVSTANETLGWLRAGPSKIPGVLRRMDLVLAGNSYLADYARQYATNVQIVPTTLDTDRHAPQPARPHQGVCIGWSGSFSTSPYLDMLQPALSRVKQRFGERVYFKVIGDAAYQRPELGITGIAWSEATEVEETAEIDIGLMPLPDDPWSRGKCGFKALLYMSMGIAAVVSPVGVNDDIVEDGVNGFKATDENMWVDRLGRLVEDPDLRAALGRRGRETVVQRYSVLSQRDRYVALFDELTGVRR